MAVTEVTDMATPKLLALMLEAVRVFPHRSFDAPYETAPAVVDQLLADALLVPVWVPPTIS